MPENDKTQVRQLIFTVCTGRCGQFSLVEYINKYSEHCLAEAEPPNLIYKQDWPLGNWARDFQRKFIVTHEDLGRGKALKWHDNDEIALLDRLAHKRLARINRMCSRNGAKTYVEVSKFFIRSYAEAVAKLRPDIGVLLLRRNPLENAKSFSNRRKKFELDGLQPDFRKTCFPIDPSRLTNFQLYLWQWVEIELRSQQLARKIGFKPFVMSTGDLQSVERVEAFFRHFSIEVKRPIEILPAVNTNVQRGNAETVVSQKDIDEYLEFVDLIPARLLDRLPNLYNYVTEISFE